MVVVVALVTVVPRVTVVALVTTGTLGNVVHELEVD